MTEGRKTHYQIFCMICDECGIEYRGPDTPERLPRNYNLTREAYQRLNGWIAKMHGAASVWERPGEIETQLEDARKKLAAAIEAIEKLDNYARVQARREALKERDAEFERQLAAIAESGAPRDEQLERMNRVIEAFQTVPREEWIDYAAIAQIKALSAALTRPIEQAIPMVQEGRGRPRNLRAYAVAEHAYVIFEELTGQKPTFWNAKETTPFGRIVQQLFNVYGIKSNVRKPIEAAMHKFSSET
ncbi:hypothetical protein [Roseovarius salinarum]|uniref:hypothetical protein n=1 Tax=Roseovarius salinarum TaxID=1981892 RepID=UPI000C32AEC9|nr:hypothetical protein [Roseovarius salinarum]